MNYRSCLKRHGTNRFAAGIFAQQKHDFPSDDAYAIHDLPGKGGDFLEPSIFVDLFSSRKWDPKKSPAPSEGMVILAMKSQKERNFLLKLESWGAQMGKAPRFLMGGFRTWGTPQRTVSNAKSH